MLHRMAGNRGKHARDVDPEVYEFMDGFECLKADKSLIKVMVKP